MLIAPSNVAAAGELTVTNATEHSYLHYVESVIPDNFIAPFLSANVLSVLLVSVAIGLAIAKLPRGSRLE